MLGAALVVAVGVLAAMSWFDRPLDEATAAARMEAAIAAGDTVALGRLASRQCGALLNLDRRSCYEDYFVTLSGEGRVALALGALASLASRDKGVEADGHVYTHVVGIRAWKPGDDVSEVYASCNGLFQSGCYHGVIQAYLTDTTSGGADSTRVAEFCDLIATRSPGRWLRFQCVHGLGHGLEMVNNYELPTALAQCDWLKDSWDKSGCYGGAFMESAVASAPGGHHTASRVIGDAAPPGTEGAGAHDHGSHDAGPPAFAMRDPNDNLYPCTAVGPRYWPSCYQLQGGIILERVGYDWARAAAECDRAPADVRHHCYLSLGTNASGISVQDIEKSIRWCSNGDPGFQPWCFVGATKNFIDVTARPADGIRFCEAVPEGKNRRQCWVAVGEQIWVQNPEITARDTECGKIPGRADAEDCRYGAGILTVAPPGLPILPGVP